MADLLSVEIIGQFLDLDVKTKLAFVTGAFFAATGVVEQIEKFISALRNLHFGVSEMFARWRNVKAARGSQFDATKQHFRTLVNRYTELYAKGASSFGEPQKEEIFLLLDSFENLSCFKYVQQQIPECISKWGDIKGYMKNNAEALVAAKSKKKYPIASNHESLRKSAEEFCKLCFSDFYTKQAWILNERFDGRLQHRFSPQPI